MTRYCKSVNKEAEEELKAIKTNFKQIWDKEMVVFDRNLKILQKFEESESKNQSIDLLKHRKYLEQCELIKEIKRTSFKNEQLKVLSAKLKDLKKNRANSEAVIESFKDKYLAKLEEYIEIYNDLENNHFEFEFDEDTQEDNPPSASILGSNMHIDEHHNDYKPTLFEKWMDIMDQKIQLQILDSDMMASTKDRINYYIDALEKKY